MKMRMRAEEGRWRAPIWGLVGEDGEGLGVGAWDALREEGAGGIEESSMLREGRERGGGLGGACEGKDRFRRSALRD